MRIGAIKILISNCTTGIYLRWYFNGWHYFNFTNGYEISQKTDSMGIQVSRLFSIISKIERSTRINTDYAYQVTLEGITAYNIGAFTGLLMAEKVEQYDDNIWREVDITRGEHLIREEGAPGYILNFEVTRKELPVTSSVYQKSLKLYLGDILCDMDDDEIVPINKQVNDIAEMQDRQSDFTSQFKIRKTRAMRDLFELSGEAGINTNFPFEDKFCRLIQDNIEVITAGQLILDKVDEQYYYVSVLSGNMNFFKAIENLKLTDLVLNSTNHTWDVATMAATHVGDPDYVYPLCEPSDDGGIDTLPGADDGDRVEMYGGWIWPFIKAKTIWDEIFNNPTTGKWYVSGDILTDDIFLKLFMPIVNLTTAITKLADYHYSLEWNGRCNYILPFTQLKGQSGVVTLLNGDANFKNNGVYVCPYTATFKFQIYLHAAYGTMIPVYVWLYESGIPVKQFICTWGADGIYGYGNWTCEYIGTFADVLTFWITPFTAFDTYRIAIADITLTQINYSTPVTPHINLPDITQIEFVKMICNMFGLIPDVTPRDRKIKFWNYRELYDNIPIARDWSAYLSERDDEMEFKFGDYAQNNILRYKDIDDVPKDSGMGIMQIDDETLPFSKETVELPISTCDELHILPPIPPIAPHNFDVIVSRIPFNKFNADTLIYDQEKTIEARIVYVDHTRSIGSPLYEKIFGIRPTVAPGGATDVSSPKKASSLEIAFSNLVTNYAGLSRLLTKTNLRRAKFNLPVYEVAGLKHYIPIYLSQYKAYFYVNKINNYVPGQLCMIDLIKL
jgi:hypothetical protein